MEPNQSEDSQRSSGQPDIKISSILSKKAMVARLATGGWSGRVTDQAATRELIELKSAKDGVVSVTKAIIDKKHFKRIREVISGMKKYHNEQTLPWDNNGGRLLPSSKFAAYNLQLRESKRELEAATVEFMGAYNSFIDEAEDSLCDLFSRSDYPSVTEIENKFALSTHFDKVPEAGDFRVDIPEHEQARLREQIEGRIEAQHAQSMKRIWIRIFKAVEHMNDRLSEENGVFRDSLIGNIEQLVEVLPSLNILEDVALAEMTQELKNTLCGYSPEDLRRNKVLRHEVVENSRSVMDRISQMEGLFDDDSGQTNLTDSRGRAEVISIL